MKGFLFASVLAVAMFTAAPLARAQGAGHWVRAETPNFIVYSYDNVRGAREAAVALEREDWVLRQLTHTQAPPSPNKLEVYLLQGTQMLQIVMPGASGNIGGFYRATPQQVAAFAIHSNDLGLDREEILFHEYAHHFMLNFHPFAYPTWYVEGWADLVSTLDLHGDHVTFGQPSQARTMMLNFGERLPIRQMLEPTPRQRFGGAFYAQSWLATLFLTNRPERMEGFARYTVALGNGDDPIDAFQPAFGITPEQFEREIDVLFAGGSVHTLTFTIPSMPQPTLTRLSQTYDNLLLLMARARGPVPDAEKAALAAAIEASVADFPNDPVARRAAARAALLCGNNAGARAILSPLAAADPADLEARFLIGLSYLNEATAAQGAEQSAAISQARHAFSQAFQINHDDAPTLYYYASTFVGDAPMSEPHLNVLEHAVELAPSCSDMRLTLAVELLKASEYDLALAVLRPLMYAPHDDDDAHWVHALAQAARDHQPPPPRENAAHH